MKVLFFGDIVGRPGRAAVKRFLDENKSEFKADLIIAQADNLASGRGPTVKTYEEMLVAGVDAMTVGDHVWDQSELLNILSDKKGKIIRPANYPDGVPGKTALELDVNGHKVLIACLLGRVFTTEGLDNPFRVADKLLDETSAKIKIIDFHAEATSEKYAMGYYLSGRVSAVLGTHTHVMTADEKIIDGTAYISDVGSCSPVDSVIGVKTELSLKRFLTGMPLKFEVADGPVQINAVLVTVDEKTGDASKIERLSKIYE